MGLRKSLGIVAFCTQAVVAVDYNMQSQKAGLGPGELSMKAYSVIVQARYNRPAAPGARAGPQFDPQFDPQSGPQSDPATGAGAPGSAAAPTPICIRRAAALTCQ
ncbi:hypothetical protein [Parasedimentitalea psychrophila]|uniref:Uncharacterized protein n=1 Tax=Parasedimentitalea psychrophila TaxID=2997337 RepID=A0A9Y2L1D1_9RHOB|nr:hypothetical protein [Parasedimentitalea psychrophila]WIY26363.1 hypothetical protein QPJ95_05450 [Parasedimentitalea psychrophila]